MESYITIHNRCCAASRDKSNSNAMYHYRRAINKERLCFVVLLLATTFLVPRVFAESSVGKAVPFRMPIKNAADTAHLNNSPHGERPRSRIVSEDASAASTTTRCCGSNTRLRRASPFCARSSRCAPAVRTTAYCDGAAVCQARHSRRRCRSASASDAPTRRSAATYATINTNHA